MNEDRSSAGDGVPRSFGHASSHDDEAAFVGLIDRSSLPLRGFLRRAAPTATRSDFDLDDLFQTVVFRAWRIRADFVDQGAGSFYRWFITVARNVIGDRLRHLHAAMREAPAHAVSPSAVASQLPDSITSASSRFRRSEDVARLLTMLDAMPERRRRIVELHHLEGATLRDVAATLGIPRSTVFDELKAAMSEMRGILDTSST